MVRTVAWVVGACCMLAAPLRAQFVDDDLYVGGWPYAIYRVEPATWNVTLFADLGDALDGVSAIAFTPSSTLICSNYYQHEVREFDAAGKGGTLFDLSTGLLGPFGQNGLAYDFAGDLFVGDSDRREIRRYPAGGGASWVFADANDGVNGPDGLAFDANGDLFVANRGTSEVLRIDRSGNAIVFDTLPDAPYSIVIRKTGDLYVACWPSFAIYRYPGGDSTKRTLFTTLSGNAGNPALQFSKDERTLYFTSFLSGNLVTIDPDTAAKKEVIPAGVLTGAISIGVVGRGVHDAAWSNYGAGFPGTTGVPAFTSQQDPVLGTTITLDLMNSYAQPTIGLLVVGFQRTDVPSSFGGHLLVVPALVVPITFSFGFDSFTGDLPLDPKLYGLVVDLQAFEADPGAAKGVSFTPGLELVLGY